MSIEFTWKIEQCESCPETGSISTVHWRCVGVDEDYVSSSYGSQIIPAAPEGTPFTPFEDVTEADVLAWVWNAGVDKDAIEQAIENSIEELKNPSVLTANPWD